MGDFKNVHTGAGDYTYDTNGNLTKDLNKGISSIAYNYLNLPETVSFGNKGDIKFVYDAAGNKLQKIVTDKTQTPNIVTTTNYVDGFIYQHIGSAAYDTLQFFPTEEGRVRYVPAHGSTAAAYVYDYFIKDHLGNTRVVLTEQTDFTQYLATMEQPNVRTEDALFYNLDNTREAKPVDYPQDNTTTPNAAVARLNGSDPDKRVGPSIILKVMVGDTIQAAVRAFYRQQATPQNDAGLPAEQMLSGLVQALVSPATQAAAMHNMRLAAPEQIASPGLTANDLQSLKQRDPDNNKTDKPKAYLNYVFFDKQFKFVDDGSGIKQVDGEPNQLETLSSGKVVAKKNGYVYVYTSNESQQDVIFDNFGVEQVTGPVLEETHYYPYGLTMAGISSTAPLKLTNNYKYNSKELNHSEFSDGSGLDWYSYGDREYDPQIGVFHTSDPYAGITGGISPYSYAMNNPVLYIDINGDSVIPSGMVQNDWHNFDTQNNMVGLNDLVVTASRGYGGYDPLYTGVSIAPLRVYHVTEKSGLKRNIEFDLSREYSFITFGQGLATAASVLEWTSRTGEGVEIGSKYLNKLANSEVLEVAGKLGQRLGPAAAGGRIAINSVRYAHGDISGAEFGYSSFITGLAIGFSVSLGPEAGIVVEGAGWASEKLYNGVNTAIEQASWGITNWEHNFQNAVAGRVINY